jgi:hypothetical protein
MRRKEELHPLTERARQVWMWSDPYFFIEKRKGDIKDHAILLCNFLLGMKRANMDAYVCIGTARQKDANRPPIPHVWVMTQEERGDERIVRFWETTSPYHNSHLVLHTNICVLVQMMIIVTQSFQEDS